MEDDESGGSSFNSSNGGAGSWLPCPSHKNINQLVPNREGLHFLPLKSWSSSKALSYLVNCVATSTSLRT